MKPKHTLRNFLLGTTLLAATPALHAASATWNGTTDATWATGTNWSTTPVPGTSDTATFNNAGGAVDIIDLGSGVTLDRIQFNSGSVAAYTIGSGAVGSQTLTFRSASTISIQYNSAVTNSQLFNANISLDTAAAGTSNTFANNSTSANLTLAGTISGTSTGVGAKTLIIDGAGNTIISGAVQTGGASLLNLTKNGAGTLTLSGANSYAGVTNINNGTLKLGANNVLPDASVVTAGGLNTNGTLDLAGFSDSVTTNLGLGRNDNTVGGLTPSIVNTGSSSAVLTVGTNVTYRAGAATFDNGQATISANLGLSGANTTFDVINNSNALEVLVSGTISGTATTLTKGNSGTLRLTGPNTYQGQTIINNGTLEVNTLANAGSASSVGFGNSVAGSDVIRIGNASLTSTLNYIGSGNSTNRRIQVGAGTASSDTGGAIVLNNGSGALVFTSATSTTPFNPANTGAIAARTLTLGGNNAGANTIQGAIVNNGTTLAPAAVNVTKQDGGTWILAGTSSYTGTTNVNGGTLVVNGNISTSLLTTVADTATLGGSGTVGALTVQSGGTLAPGNSAGTLNTGTLSLANLSNLSFELDPTNTTVGALVNDLVSVTGNLTLDGILNLTATSGSFASVTAGTTWRLFNYTGSLTDNVLTFGSMPSLGSGLSWSIDTATANQINLVAIPEPKAALLGSIGLLLLLRRRR